MANKFFKSWKAELNVIEKRHNGMLRVDDVIEFARNPKTALHRCFTWDDTKAAKEYRRWQARHIIAEVRVTLIPNSDTEVRTYVSMVEDRSKEGGGYRSIVSVLSNAEQRKRLLDQALAEFDLWKDKYQLLRELSEIFAARRRVKQLRRKRG